MALADDEIRARLKTQRCTLVGPFVAGVITALPPTDGPRNRSLAGELVMDPENFRRLLDRLREDIGDAPTLTHAMRQMLRELADDIDNALKASGEARGVVHVEHRKRLAEMVTRFEADHPGLAESMRDIMHSLGQMGL